MPRRRSRNIVIGHRKRAGERGLLIMWGLANKTEEAGWDFWRLNRRFWKH